jgi:hypothetical protein
MSPADALKELFDLLEIYAPAWFTEDQRIRVVRALGSSPQSASAVTEASCESSEPPPPSSPCRKNIRSGARRHLFLAPSRNSGNPTGGSQIQ